MSTCAGRCYFISNGEPRILNELINDILAAYRLPPVTRTVTPRLAYSLGALSELVYTVGRIKREPMMTRFVAKQLSCAHWYDISAARRDFGYTPTVTIAEGLRRLNPP